jgi:hypothetical protein
MKKLLAILILVLAIAAVPTLIAFSRPATQSSRSSTAISNDHNGSDNTGAQLGDSSNSGEDENRFESGLVGIQTPNMTVRGVSGAGRPWTVASGEAKLESGRIEVEVQGLLLTNTGNPSLDGTTGPVTGVRVSLTCEGLNVVATTAVASLSSVGNAQIEQEVSLPQSCIGPLILIRVGSTVTNPGPIMGPWIAASGF